MVWSDLTGVKYKKNNNPQYQAAKKASPQSEEAFNLS